MTKKRRGTLGIMHASRPAIGGNLALGENFLLTGYPGCAKIDFNDEAALRCGAR
jgi:hypothetical protein